MESRLRILLLTFMWLPAAALHAQEQPTQPGQGGTLNEIIQQEPVIQPEVQRREVKEADIDDENFELGAFIGMLSIEDFGTNVVYGVRLDYHITEDLFVQAAVGQSTAGNTSADNFLGGTTILSDDEEDFRYYTVAIGYNLLPGEAFIGRNTAFNTALYLIAGAGSTTFAGDDRFTITVGAGYRVILNDLMTVHLEFRDHIFAIDVTGEDKDAHNFEASMGLSFIF